jgi:hypothetical protein
MRGLPFSIQTSASSLLDEETDSASNEFVKRVRAPQGAQCQPDPNQPDWLDLILPFVSFEN